MTETQEQLTETYIPPFPVSIALIGAPGSGKEKIANEFFTLALPWFKEKKSPLSVVYNPGNALPDVCDQAVGVYGSYREDMWVFYERLSQEAALRKDGISYISSGTIIENMAHCGVGLEMIMLGLQNSGIVTPETERQVQKWQLAISTLTMLFFDSFRYSLAFYVPLAEKIILPGQDESEDRYSKRVDNAILTIFQNFGLRIQVLDQPTFEEKAQEMHKTLVNVMTEGVQIPIAPPEDGIDTIEPRGETPEVDEPEPNP